MDEMEPIIIEESPEARRRREEQVRRDAEARAAALRALQQVEPQLSEIERTAPERPEDVGAPAEPYRGRDVTPYAQLPGARPQPSGQVVLPAERQTPEMLAEHQRARASMAREAAPVAPTPRMDVEPAPAGRDPGMRAAVPSFRPPPVDRRIIEDAQRAPQRAQARQAGAEMLAQRAAMERKPAMQPPGRMDEGLPSESDIGGARDRDGWRLALAALANGLAGYSGRTMTMPRREAQELQQRRDAGLERARSAKGEAIEREESRAQRIAQASERDAARALQERSLGLQERRMDMQATSEEERRALARQELERTAQEREQRRLADSPISDAYRTTLRQRIETYRATGNTQLADSLERLYGERLDSLTAEQLEPILGRTGGLPQVHMRGRAGGGGAGAPRDGMDREQRRASLIEAGQRAGIDPAVMATMNDEDLARTIEMRTRRGLDTGEELLPGVRAGIDLSPGEARAFRTGFTEMRSQYGALGEIERVAGRYGATAAIDRRAAGEMAAPLTRLRAMVARLQNTGVINPSEAPAIEAMLPNPASLAQMTFGDLRARLGSFRGELERAVDAELSSRGVDDAGRAEALRMLRGSTGGGTARGGGDAPQAGGRRFRVTYQGQTRMATEEQARQFQGRPGFTVEEVR